MDCNATYMNELFKEMADWDYNNIETILKKELKIK